MTNGLAILTHSQGIITSVNPEFCNRFNFTPGDIIGRHPLDFIPDDWQAFVRHKMETHCEDPYYTFGCSKDGRYIPIYLQAKEVRLCDQVTERIVVVREARDLQDPKPSFLTLYDEDLTRMIHEIRTPVATILSALRMSKLAASTDKRNHYIQIAIDTCESELKLIDSTLTLKRLSAGHPLTGAEVINLGPWVLALVESFYPAAATADLSLSLDFPERVIILQTDPNLLFRILQELLSNACKYTQPDGQIQVRVAQSEAGVTFEIGNTATIPANALPHLFERFYRVTTGELAKRGGSGLGLYLAQKLVQSLEGELRVTSHDSWTTFTLWLPQLNSSFQGTQPVDSL